MKIESDKLNQSEAIIYAAETEDELGTVLRLHLVLEQCLVFYLELFLHGEIASFVKEPKEFARKLSLAVAFGFPIPIAKVLRQVNNIRNKLAHEANAQLDHSDIQELIRKVDDLTTLDKSFTKVNQRYIELNNKQPGEKLTLGTSGNRIDFLLATIAAYGLLVRWLVLEKEHHTKR